jgi:hypothetical protein
MERNLIQGVLVKKKYLIDVKQEHIDKGRRTSASSCPIALAIVDATGKSAGVTRDYIALYGFMSMRHYMPPKEAQDFIRKFDMQIPVEPFSFVLEKM